MDSTTGAGAGELSCWGPGSELDGISITGAGPESVLLLSLGPALSGARAKLGIGPVDPVSTGAISVLGISVKGPESVGPTSGITAFTSASILALTSAIVLSIIFISAGALISCMFISGIFPVSGIFISVDIPVSTIISVLISNVLILLTSGPPLLLGVLVSIVISVMPVSVFVSAVTSKTSTTVPDPSTTVTSKLVFTV